MKTSTRRKLKRHPIVRFIRGIFRLLRILFRPQRTIARLDLPRPEAIEDRIEMTSLELDPLVTVGELLGRVKWQSPSPNIQTEFTSNNRIYQPQDISRN